eukprot:CAMPEP_0202952218 /NCGR_PEP_ID=MMETSP1395-20130829/36839_1 /ASSEMBLY_ACC=CAM_ASM_000871 /TAXON_ID=5961 /ORGANISM="Blepharisma japonicum, Strain Stock R1072" /LENGTH=156 /DNA_ID=CAMNT_0049661749 /DNA_START=350 /DNA_END=817 /DNA_ORIENTATION=+
MKTFDPIKGFSLAKDGQGTLSLNYLDPVDPQGQDPFYTEGFGYHKSDSANSIGKGDYLPFLSQDLPFNRNFRVPSMDGDNGSQPEGFRFMKIPSLGDDYMFQPENFKYMKIPSMGEDSNFNPEGFKLMKIPSIGEESNFSMVKLPSLSLGDCELPP